MTSTPRRSFAVEPADQKRKAALRGAVVCRSSDGSFITRSRAASRSYSRREAASPCAGYFRPDGKLSRGDAAQPLDGVFLT